MTRKIFLVLTAVISIVILRLAAPNMGAGYQWQVALEEIKGSLQHEYARKFVDTLEEKSQGRINCKIHFVEAEQEVISPVPGGMVVLNFEMWMLGSN